MKILSFFLVLMCSLSNAEEQLICVKKMRIISDFVRGIEDKSGRPESLNLEEVKDYFGFEEIYDRGFVLTLKSGDKYYLQGKETQEKIDSLNRKFLFHELSEKLKLHIVPPKGMLESKRGKVLVEFIPEGLKEVSASYNDSDIRFQNLFLFNFLVQSKSRKFYDHKGKIILLGDDNSFGSGDEFNDISFVGIIKILEKNLDSEIFINAIEEIDKRAVEESLSKGVKKLLGKRQKEFFNDRSFFVINYFKEYRKTRNRFQTIVKIVENKNASHNIKAHLLKEAKTLIDDEKTRNKLYDYVFGSEDLFFGKVIDSLIYEVGHNYQIAGAIRRSSDNLLNRSDLSDQSIAFLIKTYLPKKNMKKEFVRNGELTRKKYVGDETYLVLLSQFDKKRMKKDDLNFIVELVKDERFGYSPSLEVLSLIEKNSDLRINREIISEVLRKRIFSQEERAGLIRNIKFLNPGDFTYYLPLMRGENENFDIYNAIVSYYKPNEIDSEAFTLFTKEVVSTLDLKEFQGLHFSFILKKLSESETVRSYLKLVDERGVFLEHSFLMKFLNKRDILELKLDSSNIAFLFEIIISNILSLSDTKSQYHFFDRFLDLLDLLKGSTEKIDSLFEKVIRFEKQTNITSFLRKIVELDLIVEKKKEIFEKVLSLPINLDYGVIHVVNFLFYLDFKPKLTEGHLLKIVENESCKERCLKNILDLPKERVSTEMENAIKKKAERLNNEKSSAKLRAILGRF